MAKIRVLVVDDSVVIRRAVADELSLDPDIEVAQTAANGKIALSRLPQVTPDLVILDVEMPEMDGLQTLAELRKSYPRLPVIMFSSLTERGAEETLTALSLGASSYFPKPQTGGLEASRQVIREQLIPQIKALCKRDKPQPVTWTPSLAAVKPPSPAQPRKLFQQIEIKIVAIGSSTGGPNALETIFAALPATFPVPVVIVQHMPPMFTRLLAERLSAKHAMRIVEGSEGAALQPGHAYIAPGDYHMTVERDKRDPSVVRLALNQGQPENSCRPAVDVLFRSVAQVYGATALGVILTGMGQDGLRGCEVFKESGSVVLAQDEATSVVWGMPGYVAKAGLASRVLPLSLLADEIQRRVASRGTGA